MSKIYRMMLAFNSILFILVVFLIKESYFLNLLGEKWMITSHILTLGIPLIFTVLVLISVKILSDDSINSRIENIEVANGDYLPSYLGYFFIALSVDDGKTFIFIFIILLVFVYYSQTLYFNPVFLLFGYHFYYITLDNKTKNIIISKRVFKTCNGIEFKNLKRINYYTFIDMEVD